MLSSARNVTRKASRVLLSSVIAGGTVVAALEVTTHLPSEGRRSAFYHSLVDDTLVPLLRTWIPDHQAEWAHWLAVHFFIDYAPLHRPSALEQRLQSTRTSLSAGSDSPNPIGLAAGLDKDGIAIAPLLALGFGTVEIGSVTLEAQPGNPTPRMFRLAEDDAIINRYGFNSLGMHQVEANLQSYWRSIVGKLEQEQQKDDEQHASSGLWKSLRSLLPFSPSTDSSSGAAMMLEHRGLVGVNLGKNKTSTTPLADYQTLIRRLGPYADYIVMNVSSPNTPGLRDLQAVDSIEGLVKGCLEACQQVAQPQSSLPDSITKVIHNDKEMGAAIQSLITKKGPPSWRGKAPPLLVKLSPDLSDKDLQSICQTLQTCGVDGIIVTNTTTTRPHSLQSAHAQEGGGLSGKPLNQLSTECIRNVYQYTQGEIPIVGVGGASNAQDVYDKLKAGASVVQLYTALIYQGPGLVSTLRHDLAQLLIQNGHRTVQEVVGFDHDDLYWKKKRQQHAIGLDRQIWEARSVFDALNKEPTSSAPASLREEK